MKKTAISFCLTALLAGCGSGGALPPQATTGGGGQAGVLNADVHPVDAEPASPSNKIITVNMYQMRVPLGTITNNPAFWKLVQEDVVDVEAAAMLYKNGFRVGRGKVSQWEKFRDIIDRDTTYFIPTHIVTPSGGDTEINVTPIVPEETLWVYNEHGWTGRSYDDCRNSFAFTLEWAPRKKNTVRVRVCPVVTTTRQRVDYSTNDDPESTSITAPEHLYDLRLFADMAPGEFLVIAPSPDVSDPFRVGHRFLTIDGAAAQYEKLIVLVGEAVPFGSAATTQPAH